MSYLIHWFEMTYLSQMMPKSSVSNSSNRYNNVRSLMFDRSKARIGCLSLITNRWTCLSLFDVRLMMFEFVQCSIKWCATHHYLCISITFDVLWSEFVSIFSTIFLISTFFAAISHVKLHCQPFSFSLNMNEKMLQKP